jgi:hypothetical protein
MRVAVDIHGWNLPSKPQTLENKRGVGLHIRRAHRGPSTGNFRGFDKGFNTRQKSASAIRRPPYLESGVSFAVEPVDDANKNCPLGETDKNDFRIADKKFRI